MNHLTGQMQLCIRLQGLRPQQSLLLLKQWHELSRHPVKCLLVTGLLTHQAFSVPHPECFHLRLSLTLQLIHLG